MFVGKLARFGFNVDELPFCIVGSDAREAPQTAPTRPLPCQVRDAVNGLGAQTIDDLLDLQRRLCSFSAILSSGCACRSQCFCRDVLFMGNVFSELIVLGALLLLLGLSLVIDGLQNRVFDPCKFVQLLADLLEV